MRQLKGTASIDDGHRVRGVHVSVDLAQGRCRILENDNTSSGAALGLWLATTDQIFLKDVRLRTGASEFFSECLGPFYLSSLTQSEPIKDKGVSDSGIASALAIDKHVDSIDEIELKPINSKIEMQVNNPELDSGSEILFHCAPRTKVDCNIRFHGEVVRVHTFRPGTALAEYVRLSSSGLNLSAYTSELRTAVSLFLRRRAFLHFARTQSAISINLAKPDQATSYGILVNYPNRHAETLERLAGVPLRPTMHFLIEAFSNPGTLEVRLLNGFVHLEIVDGGRTLSPNQVASALAIKRENADALVCVRNVMIHDGLGVSDALTEAQHRLKARPNGCNTATIVEQAFETKSPHGNFYAAVMDAYSKHLAREAGFASDWINKKVALSL